MPPIRDSGIPTFESQLSMKGLALVVWSSWRSFALSLAWIFLPGTPQLGALEWMASDDWSCGIMKASRGTVEATICTSGLHIATGRGTRGVAGATPSGARRHECYWPGVYLRPRQCRSSSLRLDTFVGTLQDRFLLIFSVFPLLVRVHEV
jgi:hypothetical protein